MHGIPVWFIITVFLLVRKKTFFILICAFIYLGIGRCEKVSFLMILVCSNVCTLHISFSICCRTKSTKHRVYLCVACTIFTYTNKYIYICLCKQICVYTLPMKFAEWLFYLSWICSLLVPWLRVYAVLLHAPNVVVCASVCLVSSSFSHFFLSLSFSDYINI